MFAMLHDLNNGYSGWAKK